MCRNISASPPPDIGPVGFLNDHTSDSPLPSAPTMFESSIAPSDTMNEDESAVNLNTFSLSKPQDSLVPDAFEHVNDDDTVMGDVAEMVMNNDTIENGSWEEITAVEEGTVAMEDVVEDVTGNMVVDEAIVVGRKSDAESESDCSGPTLIDGIVRIVSLSDF